MILSNTVVLLAGAHAAERGAFAEALHAMGAAVVILDAEGAAAPTQGAGVTRLPWRGEDSDRLAQLLLAPHGRIDGAVVLPSEAPSVAFDALDPAAFEACLAGNLDKAFHITRALSPHFAARGFGSFVYVVPAEGIVGDTGRAASTIVGLAEAGLSRAVALDFAGTSVRANCLAFVDGLQHVAAVAAFLLSDAASALTGQVVIAQGSDLHLVSQPRPLRIAHRDGGWDAQALDHGIGRRWAGAFVPPETTRDIL
ncbi:putative 3-hydroxyacyl-CoA dehydrogenase [Hyphomicrobiales bacterium]|nr:putative 3-hydroxyacyl-CoA dehydrogenase [Hyphomicrobiales bacterium]CAH1691455.1 putative 3-hydroxyacyl-CoA dehydrogenase [Hyphomicrobiales bacterium]